ncbi:porin [Paraburkholderia youngii]|uniref:porin n=1 Tax=Paraburkholderia youngii TaxID=2782701 RepID=UPI003D19A37E
MRKLLVSCAVTAAIAPVMAQAQTSVTLYGVADAFIGYFGNSEGQHVISMNSGGAGGSRWGIRAKEDLGGGLSAIAVLESGFNINNGTSGQSGRLFGRRAYVGIDSRDFGQIIAGRLQTAGYEWGGTFDPMLLAAASPLGSIGGEEPRPWIFNMLQDPARQDNTIQYSSPTWRGLNGTAAYSWGNNQGLQNATHYQLATLTYANGPLLTSYGFGHSLQPSATIARNTYEHVLGVKYDFNFVALYGTYQVRLNDPGQTDKGWQAGVTIPTGPFGTIRASYGGLSDQNITYASTNGPVTGNWAIRSAAVGYTYPTLEGDDAVRLLQEALEQRDRAPNDLPARWSRCPDRLPRQCHGNRPGFGNALLSLPAPVKKARFERAFFIHSPLLTKTSMTVPLIRSRSSINTRLAY